MKKIIGMPLVNAESDEEKLEKWFEQRELNDDLKRRIESHTATIDITVPRSSLSLIRGDEQLSVSENTCPEKEEKKDIQIDIDTE